MKKKPEQKAKEAKTESICSSITFKRLLALKMTHNMRAEFPFKCILRERIDSHKERINPSGWHANLLEFQFADIVVVVFFF